MSPSSPYVVFLKTTTTTTVAEGVFVPQVMKASVYFSHTEMCSNRSILYEQRLAEDENNDLFAHPNVERKADLDDEHERVGLTTVILF